MTHNTFLPKCIPLCLRARVFLSVLITALFVSGVFTIPKILSGELVHAQVSAVWPAKIDLRVGESASYTLQSGSTRTLTLNSYQILIPRQKVEATVQVAGGGRTDTHTLRVSFDGTPVCVNGLRLYAYAWKEANSNGFEPVGEQGGFPLTSGKDVGFGVSDCATTMFPDMEKYTYPFENLAFHEGVFLQTFLDPDGWAHSAYDVGVHSGQRALAITDGYAYYTWYAGQGYVTIKEKQDKYSTPGWIITHIKDGTGLVSEGQFVRKGTPLAAVYGDPPSHYHWGSTPLSTDFGTWIFGQEIWNYEHRNDFPAPRQWLVLGPFSGGMNSNILSNNENGNIPSSILPKKGATVGGKTWKFVDNLVNSVVRMGELVSAAPFSGYEVDRDPLNSVGYAATYIYAPSATTATLKWGMSYGGRIWLNGTSVFNGIDNWYSTYNEATQSPLVIDKYTVPLSLQQGWNTLIIKTNNGNREWWNMRSPWLFSPKIGDAAGQKLPQLVFSTRDINLQATPADTTIALSWQNPNFHGTFVDTYKLDVATDAGFSALVVNNRDLGKVTSYTITGLNAGTTYYIRVRPYNNADMGGSTYWQHSDAVSATTTGARVDNVPFSRTPPNGLSPSQVPQLVMFASDDNWMSGGVRWFLDGLYSGKRNPAGTGNAATYDGIPVRGTFHVIGKLESYGTELRDELIRAYNQGNEIGNHGYWGIYAEAPSGYPTTTQDWKDKWMIPTNDFFTRAPAGDGVRVPVPYECNPPGSLQCTTPRFGLGIPSSAIYAWRTPMDAYNDATFPAITDLGFTYTSGTATGHPSQSTNGTDQHWPGTLDNGLPFATPLAGVDSIPPTPGLWEIPQNYMWLPPSVGTGVIGYCDKDWLDAPVGWRDDPNGAAKIEAMLKYNLDLHYNNNRAPFQLCLHSQEWGIPSWASPSEAAKIQARQQALKNFLEYALSKPDVRAVNQIDVINWMRNPAPLGVTPVQQAATPTISPSGGTFSGNVTVTISTATAGADIRYTIDGSTPTMASPVYTGPFTLSSTATVKAFATLVEMNSSAVATANFTVTPLAPSTKFTTRDRVQATTALNVRSTPSLSGTLLGTKSSGEQGTVVGGPQFADGFWRWQIDYDTAPDGWSVEDGLEKVIAPLPPGATAMTVNAGRVVNPFDPKMRGVQLSTWEYAANRKAGPMEHANLAEVAKALEPGILRFAGGLWVNGTGWDRSNAQQENYDPARKWNWTDPDTGARFPFGYWHVYNAAMIDSLGAFAKAVGADVMMQINICDNNPKMWADLVKYANVEHTYDFKYWELSNELSLDNNWQWCLGKATETEAVQEYANRFLAYRTALLAVDPTLKFMGPVTHQPWWLSAVWQETPTGGLPYSNWLPPLVDTAAKSGRILDVASWHRYPMWDPLSLSYVRTRLFDIGVRKNMVNDVMAEVHRLLQVYNSQGTQTAITELNTHVNDNIATNSNHIGALWMLDILPRYAYNGLDMNIWYDLEDSTYFELVTNNGGNTPTQIFARPTYYGMLMLSRYFGDQMVESSTSDSAEQFVVWATRDTADPAKLKMILVNMKDTAGTASINIAGFTPTNGIAYELTNANPTDLTLASADPATHTERINGVKIDTSTGNVESSINAIPPKTITGISGNTVTYALPAYSAAALVISSTGTPLLSVSSLDRAYVFLDRPTVLYLLGAGLEADEKFKLKLKSEAGQEFELEVEAKDAGSIELDLSKANLFLFTPGFYEIEIERESDGSKTTLAQRLLLTKLGDLTRDGKVSILDVSLLLSRWNSILQADLDVADVNGPQGLPDGKIDIYDANKMMANWGP